VIKYLTCKRKLLPFLPKFTFNISPESTKLPIYKTCLLPGYGHQNPMTIYAEVPRVMDKDPCVPSIMFAAEFKENGHSWPESAGELYRQSDRRLPAILLSTFAERGRIPYGRSLGFSLIVATTFHLYSPLSLYSRG
jgi:hypothetical protein